MRTRRRRHVYSDGDGSRSVRWGRNTGPAYRAPRTRSFEGNESPPKDDDSVRRRCRSKVDESYADLDRSKRTDSRRDPNGARPTVYYRRESIDRDITDKIDRVTARHRPTVNDSRKTAESGSDYPAGSSTSGGSTRESPSENVFRDVVTESSDDDRRNPVPILPNRHKIQNIFFWDKPAEGVESAPSPSASLPDRDIRSNINAIINKYKLVKSNSTSMLTKYLLPHLCTRDAGVFK